MEVVCGSESFTGGWHPMSKRTWGIAVVKVIKRERNQAIALALGGKCQKDRSGRFTRGGGHGL